MGGNGKWHLSTTVEIQYEFETFQSLRENSYLQQQKFSMSLKPKHSIDYFPSTTVEIQYEFETNSTPQKITTSTTVEIQYEFETSLSI